MPEYAENYADQLRPVKNRRIKMTLNAKKQLDLLERGFSRRNFGIIAGMMAAAGSSLPLIGGEPSLAQLSKITNIPADAVMINANENPLGPSPEALAAAQKICVNGGR